ncbi:MAG: DNA methyltransferase [Methylococcaceae bacterium]
MKNKIYYGDNLEVLRRYIKDESVDLCYIDPPFNSKRNYNQIYNNVGKEDKAQAQAFIDTWVWDDYANKGLLEIQSNYNGVFTEQSIDLITGLEKVLKKGALLAYLVSMTLRVAEIHRVLKPTGSFYFHCDPTASHYLKLVIDAIFCPKGGELQNEIVWHYSGWNAKLKESFSKRHDIIFFYSKKSGQTFNSFVIPYSSEEEYLKLRKQKVLSDEQGNKYVLSDAGGGKRVKRYLAEAMDYGKPVSDVWTLDKINNSSKERMGYPTQKPESLLERIIKASSNEGDVILDVYCGCGTTVAVAEKLKRHWIGVDITYQSISLILKRLEDNFGSDFTQSVIDSKTQQIIPASLEINGVPKDIDSAVALANKKDDRTRKEFEKWIILTYSKNRAIINEKKGGDKGIDGIAYIPDYNDKGEIEHKKVLFSVKSSKTLTPSMINELNGVVDREKAACGIFLCLYPAPNLVKASKEFGRYYNKLVNNDYPKIQVISVADIFAGQFIELPNVAQVLKTASQHSTQSSLF